jgi:glucose-1-phosphate thymidylyltransferase
MSRKGIILAGGSGTRLYPMTRVVCKQLLPVYDKPMIYFPLTTLMLAGIREIFLITTPTDAPLFRQLLGDGSQWGLSLSYGLQPSPDGLAQALLLADDFLAGDSSVLILGDNIYYADGLTELLTTAAVADQGATIFAYWVKHPERYGVVEFAPDGMPVALVEKPCSPRSPYAVTGLYFYDAQAPALARTLRPSARGELEITDLNRLYLECGQLAVKLLSRGVAWFDTGTPDSLLDAANFLESLEHRQGLKIGCPEEVAFRQGFISLEQLAVLAAGYRGAAYGQYLANIVTAEATMTLPVSPVREQGIPSWKRISLQRAIED